MKEAYAWIQAAIESTDKWHQYELDMPARWPIATCSGAKADGPKSRSFCSHGSKRDSEIQSVYEQYVSALIWSNQVEQARSDPFTMDGRSRAIRKTKHRVERRKLNAAVNVALGYGFELYRYQIHDRWLGPLKQVVLHFAEVPDEQAIVSRIAQHHGFHKDGHWPAAGAGIWRIALKGRRTH